MRGVCEKFAFLPRRAFFRRYVAYHDYGAYFLFQKLVVNAFHCDKQLLSENFALEIGVFS